MSQVWEGRDERLGRPVAVKLLTTVTGSDDHAARFTREAAVTAGLVHPGVPAIHDAGEYDNGLFLVMELVDGYTIGDLIAEQGPLPVPWVAAIGAQVAAVLASAHDREIIHRDIKPQNVMLMRDGTVKVLDFGVAGIMSQRITGTGVAVGTPAYMAPEQTYNLPATPRTDLYALGCLLYEMLSGEPLFTGSSPAALMRMHLEQAPAPLRRADLATALAALVWQLLEKDPAHRPASARETYSRLLPYIGPPGPLGDINPATVRDRMQLYAQPVALLSGFAPAPLSPSLSWALSLSRARPASCPRYGARAGRSGTACGYCPRWCAAGSPGCRSPTSGSSTGGPHGWSPRSRTSSCQPSGWD